MHRVHATTLLFVGIVLLSGCLGGGAEPTGTATPTPLPGDPITVDVTNEADTAYIITVSVIGKNHVGLEAEFAGGEVRQYPEADGYEDLSFSEGPQVLSLRPLNDTAKYRVLRWDGANETTFTFESVPENARVMYTVSDPEANYPLVSFTRLTCDEGESMTAVAISIDADGTVTSTNDCK